MRFDARRFAALAALGMGLVACGPGEGDVWVYRVAVEPVSENQGCYYPDEEPPIDDRDDRSSFFNSSTWVLFVTSEGKFLDVGGAALVEKRDEDWVFETVSVDVSFIGEDQSEAVLTQTTHNTVNLDRDGDAVQGTVEQRTITRCDFLTATPSGDVCPAPPPPDCVRSADFSGVRLDDVELTEGVDKDQGAAPPPMP